MSSSESNRSYSHFRWIMPGGIPNGPIEPLVFSIIGTEVLLKDAMPVVEELRTIIDGRNYAILEQSIQNLLKDPTYGSQQQHMIVFASAPTKDPIILQAGTVVLFKILEKQWSGLFKKTISLIPMPWMLFEIIQEATTKGGCWPTPIPSEN